MAIKEAIQKGNNQVYIKNDKNHGTSMMGKLIGFTSKVVYILKGKNLHIIKDNFTSTGVNIVLQPKEEAIMFGANVGLKTGNRIRIIDENGRSAGIKYI